MDWTVITILGGVGIIAAVFCVFVARASWIKSEEKSEISKNKIICSMYLEFIRKKLEEYNKIICNELVLTEDALDEWKANYKDMKKRYIAFRDANDRNKRIDAWDIENFIKELLNTVESTSKTSEESSNVVFKSCRDQAINYSANYAPPSKSDRWKYITLTLQEIIPTAFVLIVGSCVLYPLGWKFFVPAIIWTAVAQSIKWWHRKGREFERLTARGGEYIDGILIPLGYIGGAFLLLDQEYGWLVIALSIAGGSAVYFLLQYLTDEIILGQIQEKNIVQLWNEADQLLDEIQQQVDKMNIQCNSWAKEKLDLKRTLNEYTFSSEYMRNVIFSSAHAAIWEKIVYELNELLFELVFYDRLKTDPPKKQRHKRREREKFISPKLLTYDKNSEDT